MAVVCVVWALRNITHVLRCYSLTCFLFILYEHMFSRANTLSVKIETEREVINLVLAIENIIVMKQKKVVLGRFSSGGAFLGKYKNEITQHTRTCCAHSRRVSSTPCRPVSQFVSSPG